MTPRDDSTLDRVHVMEEGGVVVIERPRSLNVALAGLGFTILLNFSAFIWGASKMSSSIDALKETTNELKTAVQGVQHSAGDLDGRVRVLEDREIRRADR